MYVRLLITLESGMVTHFILGRLSFVFLFFVVLCSPTWSQPQIRCHGNARGHCV